MWHNAVHSSSDLQAGHEPPLNNSLTSIQLPEMLVALILTQAGPLDLGKIEFALCADRL